VFDVLCSNFDFANFHLFSINYIPPCLNFRYQEHQDAQDPGRYSPSPPRQRQKTKHTLDKERQSREKQASRVLRGIDNQVDSVPTSPRNYSDSDGEMARKKLAQEAKKRAQEAISGSSVAQPPRRGGRTLDATGRLL